MCVRESTGACVVPAKKISGCVLDCNTHPSSIKGKRKIRCRKKKIGQDLILFLEYIFDVRLGCGDFQENKTEATTGST